MGMIRSTTLCCFLMYFIHKCWLLKISSAGVYLLKVLELQMTCAKADILSATQARTLKIPKWD
jgi:hypothetical protein